jgi:hypothetical protein
MTDRDHQMPLPGPPASMLGRTFRRHLVTLPVWALRIAIDGMRTGPWILGLLVLDACLWALHRRANRPAEHSAADRATLGEYNSWTKAFYMPEALAVALILRDLWYVYQSFRH